MLGRTLVRVGAGLSAVRSASVRAMGGSAAAHGHGHDSHHGHEHFDPVADAAKRPKIFGVPRIFENEKLPEVHHEPVMRWDGSMDLNKTHFASPYDMFGPYGGYNAHEPHYPEYTEEALKAIAGPQALKVAYENGVKAYAEAKTEDEKDEKDFFMAFAGAVADVDNLPRRIMRGDGPEQAPALGEATPGKLSFMSSGQKTEVENEDDLEFEDLTQPGTLMGDFQDMAHRDPAVKISAVVTLLSAAAMLYLTIAETKHFFDTIDEQIAIQDGKEVAHH